jgi:hypothetical protein
MGLEICEPHDISLIYLRKYKARCLSKSAMWARVIVEFKRCLEDLESAKTSEEEKASERYYIRRDLITALSSIDTEETTKLRKEHLADAHNEMGDELRQMISTHNLSNALIRTRY